jgi:hypothetical protein
MSEARTHCNEGHALANNAYRTTSGALKCKTCHRVYRKRWEAKNPGRAAEARKRWRLANPAKHKATQRKWTVANPRKVRAKDLRRDFGISLEQYEELFEQQGGCCGICRRPCTGRPRLAVDHNHETDEIRGLLCRACNTALGLLGDSAQTLTAALAYLQGKAVGA